MRVLFLVICFSIPAIADSWARPVVKEVFSKDRTFFVRITPGESIGDTHGFASAPKGGYARAEWYKRQPDKSYTLIAEVTLQNPVAPVDFWVSNTGHLITRDNWHNLGYGVVIAIYGPDAKLIKSYKLEDLFTAEQIQKFPHSVSSIWWHKSTPAYLQPDEREFYMALDQKGTELIFKLSDGSFRHCAWQGEQHVCR